MPLGTLLNSTLNILSAAVAILVSYYAYRANRLVQSEFLRYIALGFLLVGAGLFLAALTQSVAGLTPVDAVRLRGFGFVEFLIYVFLELVAYLVFALGYARSAFGIGSKSLTASTAAAAGALVTLQALRRFVVVYGIYLFAQLGIVVLLLFILVQGLIIYTNLKSPLTASVFFAFVLIFVAHLLLFSAVVVASGDVFLLGNFVQFLGFLSLLFFLLRSRSIGPA